jgi:pantoate--beta-alanine ligase
MEVFEGIDALKNKLEELKKAGKTIGFVPTMGALHEGHCSLVSQSKAETDVTIVSIFVNPTQFNDKNDLKNYPRTFDTDSQMLESLGVDYIFFPSEKEMYPTPSTEVWDFGMLDKVMEGAHRPGHFNGVAIIVKKLFEIVMPHKAYFGLKDFQQLTIIKELVRRLQYPIDLVDCAIVRESDGLAMSSRNTLLSPEERLHAANISKILFQAQKIAPSIPLKELEKKVIDEINSDQLLSVEYFQIVDNIALQPVSSWDEPKTKVGCVAVKIGKVRLIDNIVFSV